MVYVKGVTRRKLQLLCQKIKVTNTIFLRGYPFVGILRGRSLTPTSPLKPKKTPLKYEFLAGGGEGEVPGPFILNNNACYTSTASE